MHSGRKGVSGLARKGEEGGGGRKGGRNGGRWREKKQGRYVSGRMNI